MLLSTVGCGSSTDGQPGNDGSYDGGSDPEEGEVAPTTWLRTFGSEADDYNGGLAIAADRSVMTSGFAEGAIRFDPVAGIAMGSAFFATAFDAGGRYRWTWAAWAEPSYDVPLPSAQVAASGAGIAVTGYFGGEMTVLDGSLPSGPFGQTLPATGKSDGFAVRLDGWGKLVRVVGIGGPDADVSIRDGSLGSDGSLVVAGKFTGAVDFDPGNGLHVLVGSDDGFILKLGPELELMWVAAFEAEQYILIDDLDVSPSGRIAAVGCFTGPVDLDPGPASLRPTASPGNQPGFIAVLSPAGALEWGAAIGGSRFSAARGAAFAAGEELVVAGAFETSVNLGFLGLADVRQAKGSNDVFLALLDVKGRPRWARTFGGSGWDVPYTVTVLADGGIAVAGSFNGTIEVDGQARPALGENDAFLLRADAGGNVTELLTFGGTERDYALFVAADPAGGYAAAGGFRGQSNFAFMGVPDVRSSKGENDLFVWRFER